MRGPFKSCAAIEDERGQEIPPRSARRALQLFFQAAPGLLLFLLEQLLVLQADRRLRGKGAQQRLMLVREEARTILLELS